MASSKVGGALVGGIFLLVGLGLLTGGGIVYLNTKAFVARAYSAPGRVIANETHRDSDGDTMYTPVFEFYDADARVHRVKSSISSHPASFNVGEQVTVLYEPDNPDDANIDSFGQLWLVPTILLPMGLVFALIGAFASGLLGMIFRRGRTVAGAGVELTPRPPTGDTSAARDSAADTDNPYARTDGPVRKESKRGDGGFGSGAKYE